MESNLKEQFEGMFKKLFGLAKPETDRKIISLMECLDLMQQAYNAGSADREATIEKLTDKKRITICGSTKFKDAFLEFNRILTLQGNVVYSVSFFGHADSVPLTVEEKTLLDDIHKAKIDNSDEIFVLDVNNYIGSSTKSEIDHALKTGKVVRYLSVEYPAYKGHNEYFPQCRESGKCSSICALCYDLI